MDLSASYINLMNKNESYLQLFEQSKIMKLFDTQIASNAKYDFLLDCIQLFSNNFQDCVMLKYVFTDNPIFKVIAHEHLDDEYNHHSLLMQERGNRPSVWDPILDATTSWFSWKILSLDNIEKSVLMHLVLESSANTFFKKAHTIMLKYNGITYFSKHAECDDKHASMVNNLLKDLREQEYLDCLKVQYQGWEMLITACNRIADIVDENINRNSKIAEPTLNDYSKIQVVDN